MVPGSGALSNGHYAEAITIGESDHKGAIGGAGGIVKVGNAATRPGNPAVDDKCARSRVRAVKELDRAAERTQAHPPVFVKTASLPAVALFLKSISLCLASLMSATKFWTVPELLVIPVPLMVNNLGAVKLRGCIEMV
jgi:hypothetical protein